MNDRWSLRTGQASCGGVRPAATRARRHDAWTAFINRPLVFVLLALGRRLGEVVRIPGIGVMVNDAEIGRAILLDGTGFNSHDPGSFGYMITRVLGPRALINMDGHEHRVLKRELMEVFSARTINEMIGCAADGLVLQLRDDLLAGRVVDFAAFMRHYGGAIACALVGVKVDAATATTAYEEIFELATEIMALAGGRRHALSAADAARARAYLGRLGAFIRSSFDASDAPDGSLTQRLRAREIGYEDVKDMVAVVLVGATELIIYGLPRIFAVLVDSEAMTRLAAEPERLEQAIDEGFRVVTPSAVILRAVAADREVAGHHFRRGERTLIVFRNIMRQRKHFRDPDAFHLDRVIPPNLRRLPFGAGPHTCLGTGMALAEARHVLGTLAALGGHFTIVRRRCNRGKLYPGYTELLIRLDRPAGAPVTAS